MKKPILAMMYDFDGTLSPQNMQEYDFIPDLGVSPFAFWQEASHLAEQNDMDQILAYMYLMLKKANAKDIPVKKTDFTAYGKHVKLFDGVNTWFDRINAYATQKGLCAEHYIISSGLKEMIEGTTIAHQFENIYASSFYYDVNGVAVWPAVAVNYTSKTQFLFKINKGVKSIPDTEKVNEYLAEDERRIPFRNMVYIGDGLTDVPCMKLVKVNGGHSIAVYKDHEEGKVKQLQADERVDYVAPCDYRKGSAMERLLLTIMDKVAAVEELVSYKNN